MPILEIAEFEISPGSENDFADAYRRARSFLAASSGFRTLRMTQGVETPTRFVLLVEWDAVEDHLAFRDSERFTRWRAEIGPYFAKPPYVEHFQDVL